MTAEAVDGTRRANRGRRASRLPRRSSVVYLGLLLIGSAVSLLARSHVPVGLGASPIDGGLFVRQATYLAHGKWLGPFDNLTLAKGPAYPTFIDWMHAIGLPLKIGEQLTWLLAALCTAGCVWVVTHRRGLAVAAYLILALCPDRLGALDAGDMRDGWYASLSLLFVSALFLAVYGALRRTRLAWVIAAGMLSGLSGGAFWLCREEGPWLLPSVAVVAFGLPVGALISWRFGSPPRRPGGGQQLLRTAARYGAALVATAALFIAPLAVVMAQNSAHYGTTLTNDFTQGAFARAYEDWGRVEAGSTHGTVNPISRAQRQAVYQVSPAARELEPTLESPTNPWRRLACRTANSDNCDISGASIPWAIRDAARDSGHFRTEPSAQQFFTELSEQIESACSTHQLSCRAKLPLALQPLERVAAGAALRTFVHAAWDSIWSDQYAAGSKVGYVVPQNVRAAARAVISPVALTQAAGDAQIRAFQSHDWPYRALAAVYRIGLVVLLAAGAVGVVLGFARPRWPRAALSILGVALAAGAATRLALFTVVDLTQYSTGGPRYQLATRSVLYAFGVVGSAVLVEHAWARRFGQRTGAHALRSRRTDAGCDSPLTAPRAEGQGRPDAVATPSPQASAHWRTQPTPGAG